jgi:hypothetical protein
VSETLTPYLEVFGCYGAAEDGCEHEGDCAWGFSCGTCGRLVDSGPCPDHAPLDVPGLVLAECTATPRHPHTFFFASDGYPPPCMYCACDALRAAHAPCEHSRHGPWRRWRAVHRVLHWLVLAGVANGARWTQDQYCRGCLSHFRWHLSGYVLGWPKRKWRCLLREHHWPGVLVFADICGKCCPCPGCSSVTLEHRPGCEVGAW